VSDGSRERRWCGGPGWPAWPLWCKVVSGNLFIALVLIGAILATGTGAIRSALTVQAETMAGEIENLLNELVTPMLVSRDYAQLLDFVNSLKKRPNVLHLSVRDLGGTLIAAIGDEYPLPSAAGPPPAVISRTVTLSLAGVDYGVVKFGLSSKVIDDAYRDFATQVVIWALIISAIGLAAMSFAGYLMARNLGRLTQTVATFAGGDLSVRAAVVGRDEIARLAATFNGMAEALHERLIQLEESTMRYRAVAQELALARDAAEQASRAKTQFLANMSHEVRTPMNAILGLTQILTRTGMARDQQDFVDKIAASGRSLLGILNDILDLSRIETGHLHLEIKEFDLAAVMDGLSTILSIDAGGKALDVLIGIDSDVPPWLTGDPFRLQQILINLAGNAIKFTERGEVVVRVSRVVQTGNLLGGDGRAADGGGPERRPVGECLDGRTVVLRFSVTDSGVGIAEDQKPLLFAPFTQADGSTTRRFGGSGLGLAISRRLVELMNGEIGFSSRLGHGSVFWFTVPLAVALVPDTVPEQKRTEILSGLRILIVDDSPIARDLLATIAQSLGWISTCVDSGAAALAYLHMRRAVGAPVDVVLVDWRMPDQDGLETSRQIRQQGNVTTPIIIMVTAYDRADLHARGDISVLDAVLLKPLTASSLFEAVRLAYERRGKRPQTPPSGAGPSGFETGDLAGGPGFGGGDAFLGQVDSRQRLVGVRILLVEDNAINQEVAEFLLTEEGAIVEVAGHGAEALDKAAGTPAGYDLVLMDLHMPVMDGYEATRRLREGGSCVKVPIIAMTADAMPQDRIRCLEAGMNDHMAKPFDAEQLVAMVCRWTGANADSETV